ncbi:zf-CCHC domain-containing protein [Tanacetum coccineum]|uniref:Zf-CCHC domain-containing protein n=1 Tax=Tanacetum coccineum TaxID=301880 RepID=A0ABQ5J465_9ASTR
MARMLLHHMKSLMKSKENAFKNDEAKMVLYNASPKKKYERIFMCDTAKNIWDSLITTHQALDESFSSRNHVRKFLRALPSKWRPKVTAIEESKDLSKLSLDELVGNLKVYEVILEKDLEIAKNKKEKDFKKFFRRRGKFVRQPYDDKKNFRKIKEERREDRRCFKCGDPNHFISDCPKNSSGDQKAFVVGSWSDSGDDSKKEEICLMAHSNEVRQKVKLDPDEWIQDSGCTRHMTGNKDLFSSYKPFDGGNVLFGSNTKSKIIGKGDLPPSTTNPSPPRPSFATIERLANEPPPIPPIDSTYPSPTPELEPTPPPLPPQCLPPPSSQLPPLPPLGPNNPFPLLTSEMYLLNIAKRTQVLSFTHSKQDEQQFESLDTSEFVEELELVEE